MNELWVWNGKFEKVLAHVRGKEPKWLIEKGVLQEENEDYEGVSDLLKGDTVYRLRTVDAFESPKDPREDLFSWSTVNPETRVETPRPDYGV